MTKRSKLIGHDMLQAWSDDDLHRLVLRLNDTGIAIDEDEWGLGPMLIKVWTKECERLLGRHGYAGGPLLPFGLHDRSAGTLLCIFDLDRWQSNAVVTLLQSRLAQHRGS